MGYAKHVKHLKIFLAIQFLAISGYSYIMEFYMTTVLIINKHDIGFPVNFIVEDGLSPL